MRIGLVVPGFSADAADWCIPALRHLARALARADEVEVFALRYPFTADRYAIDGARVIALGGAARRGAASMELWRTTLSALASEHRRRPFDVLHAFWATESGLLAALAGRRLGIPTVVSLAGGELVALRDIGYGDQRLAWERLKVRASLRLASAVTAGSELLSRLAARFVSCRRLSRAPLGVDLDLFSPAATAPTTAPRLLHVGTLTPVKDQLTLLRAFAALRERVPTATLDVVGEGPLRQRLENLSLDLGLDGAIHFPGDVDHAALPDLYRAATALVVSSRHEAQSMVALEAAACGTPLVGTRVGVIPELTSGVVDVGDQAGLARLSLELLEARDSVASTARARVQADFALGVCADRFRRLYQRLNNQ